MKMAVVADSSPTKISRASHTSRSVVMIQRGGPVWPKGQRERYLSTRALESIDPQSSAQCFRSGGGNKKKGRRPKERKSKKKKDYRQNCAMHVEGLRLTLVSSIRIEENTHGRLVLER